MSEKRDLLAERINNLMVAIADLAEKDAAQNRITARMMLQVMERMGSIEETLKTLTHDLKQIRAQITLDKPQ